MSKKKRIKLAGSGWDKFKDSFRYSHIYQNAIIEVSFDDPLIDEFIDHHGHKWCATDVFYAIEILPDEPVEEESPAKKQTESKIKTVSFEILPCPFCGNSADVKISKIGGIQMTCTNEDCGCSLPSWLPFEENDDFTVFEKIDLAIEYWNTRV
jgi:hypothetical protein